MTLEFNILPEDSAQRIDTYLSATIPDLSRSAVQLYINDGLITVNSKPVKKNYQLRAGDSLSVSIPEPREANIVPEDIPLDIVYEDSDLLVVNKPQGMVVHPAPGNYSGTLVNALLAHCGDSLSGINGVIRPGIVHRIDKDTSGLLIVAKNDAAHCFLSEQISSHSFTREYEAICCGHFSEPEGTYNAPIGRCENDRKKMCVTVKNSREAITHYQVVETLAKHSYVRITLETGRTHQIRVHFSFYGHPIYGDPVYGKSIKGLLGQCLHARRIGFIHPSTKKYMEFCAGPPAYFAETLRKLS